MKNYKIFETKEFNKTFEILPQKEKNFIRKKLETYIYPQLRNEPFMGKNIKKLKSYDPPCWRYRVGNFRLFYLVDNGENIVYMLTVDDRKNAYK